MPSRDTEGGRRLPVGYDILKFMNKKLISFLVLGIVVISLIVYLFSTQSKDTTKVVEEDATIDLPINVLPLAERPFITLAPDSTGRSLNISVSGAPTTGDMEYEMVYSASGKQEGALGSIFLGSEKQPITKAILLGSKSGGGKITYHEGVTGGSITLTYASTRLKESWNYLHFNPADPSFSTTDAKLNVTLQKTALKKDAVIITMKNFGYLKTGLPDNVKVIAGPYSYYAQSPLKSSATISLKMPAGEHVNPTMYEWNSTTWKKLPAKLASDTLTASSTSNVFLITAD